MAKTGGKGILMRMATVLGVELFLVLGLLLSFKYQGSVVGLALEGRAGPASNLVANYSFEPPMSTTRTCQGQPAPYGWCCSVWQGDATLDWYDDPDMAYSGTHSVRIIGHSSDADAGWRTDPVSYFPVEEGKQYSFMGWVRPYYLLDSAGAYLKLRFLDDDGESVRGVVSNPVVDSTHGWVQVEGGGVAPEGATKGRLEVRLAGKGYVHFDDVIVFPYDDGLDPFLVLNVDTNPYYIAQTGTLTYVATLSNTGGASANAVCLTGTLDSRASLMSYESSRPASYERMGERVHVWSFVGPLPPVSGSLSVTMVVSVYVGDDTDAPVSSTFEGDAENADSRTLTRKTPISSLVYLPLISRNYPPLYINNGGFEDGWTGWQHGGKLNQYVSSNNPHWGMFSALLGDPAYECRKGVPKNASAWMQQTVSVPSTDAPELVFTYNIFTHDKNSALEDEYDRFEVLINGSSVFSDMNTTDPYKCDNLRDLGWRSKTTDLSAYKGTSITLRFENWNRYDTWFNTWTYVDDVRIRP